MSLRRIGMVGFILGILLVADGIYMVVSQYNGGETQAWNLPDGWIIIISAAVLLVASVIALVLPSRSRQTTVAPSRVKSEVGSEKG
jgi:drug/metabolite transporter (DMT)-like permease